MWDRSRNSMLFLSENEACSALRLSVPSSLLFIWILTCPSFEQLLDLVCTVKFRLTKVWQTACHWLHNCFWLSCSRLYHVGIQSLETPVIQFLDKMCLGTWKEVGVTFRINVNMHLEVTITQNELWQCHKTKKFTHCRLLFKHVAHLLCIIWKHKLSKFSTLSRFLKWVEINAIS
jgi:hypothetical protein